MTTTPNTVPPAAVDLYRDIHKGIRVNLFDVTAQAGRVDPSDRDARIALAALVADLSELLTSHAEHEDAHLEGPITEVLPEQATVIADDHVAFETSMDRIKELAYRVFDAARAPFARADVHELYLELAAFTGRYLAHQDIEERVVQPALVAALGADRVTELHVAIVSSIPPETMAWSLTKMIPAMNPDDRFELVAGMQASGAPAEAVVGVLALASEVLSPEAHAQLVDRVAALAS